MRPEFEEVHYLASTDVTEEMSGVKTIACNVQLANGENYLSIGLWNFKIETYEEAYQREYIKSMNQLRSMGMSYIDNRGQ